MSHEDKNVALTDRRKRLVMGDVDRTEFHFNVPLSDDELLIMLETNAYMDILCNWMVAEATKNGFELADKSNVIFINYNEDGTVDKTLSVKADDYLEKIKFMAKMHRAFMFARLHGESIGVFFNESPDMTEASKTGTYSDFAIYHRLANGNGWRVKEVDKLGNPTVYDIKIINKKDKIGTLKQFDVTSERVVVFPNPKKGSTWGGTASSDLIAHQAQLLVLIQKWMGKHALDIASLFWLVSNVKNAEHADEIQAEIEKFPLMAMFIKGEIKMEPMALQTDKYAQDFKIMIDILKDYIAAGCRVSRQTIDGAPEGTLSSAKFNTIMSMSSIQDIQRHWKPYTEESLTMLGFKNPKITWNEPLELPELSPDSRAAQKTKKDIDRGE